MGEFEKWIFVPAANAITGELHPLESNPPLVAGIRSDIAEQIVHDHNEVGQLQKDAFSMSADLTRMQEERDDAKREAMRYLDEAADIVCAGVREIVPPPIQQGDGSYESTMGTLRRVVTERDDAKRLIAKLQSDIALLRRQLEATPKMLEALTELLRLYDWRNQLGRDLKEGRATEQSQKGGLLRYGQEKKAAWIEARAVIANAS